MLESASILSFYVAFALAYGADPRRFPVRRWRPTRDVLRGMKLAGALSATAGIALWARAEGLAAALLVGLTALSVAATLFILLAPVAPRVLWSLALGCAPLIVVLASLGGMP